MSAYKRINNSDVIVSPYIANKQWNFKACEFSQNAIQIYFGTNLTSSFSIDNDPISNGFYERLVYDSMNHLYYQNFSGSLLNNNLNLQSNNYQSSSIYRLSGSYYDYSKTGYISKYFPTSSNSQITVVSIPKSLFGTAVDPGTFNLTFPTTSISDDGNQNLYDTASVLVGNIFYEHGIAVIGHPDFQGLFPKPPLAVNNTLVVTNNNLSQSINIVNNDINRSGTLLTSSIQLSGSTDQIPYWNNNGDGTLTVNTVNPGTYEIYYTIQSYISGSCPLYLKSNLAKVKVLVNRPTTTTTTTTTTSTTTTTTTLAPTSTTTTTTTTTAAPTSTTTTSTTTTTTTLAPTTTTSTTTTTTTLPANYNITIVDRIASNNSNVSGAIGYSTDKGSTWTYLTGTFGYNANYITGSGGGLTIPYSSSLWIAVVDATYSNVTFDANTYPVNHYTGYCGTRVPVKINAVTSSLKIYVNIDDTSGVLSSC
jgi:hypothetical protein